MNAPFSNLPVISHAGFLEELKDMPAFLVGYEALNFDLETQYSWPFYTGGWNGNIDVKEETIHSQAEYLAPGWYRLRCYYFGQLVERPALLKENGRLEVRSSGPIASPGVVVMAQLENDETLQNVLMQSFHSQINPEDKNYIQTFNIYRTTAQIADRVIDDKPTESFVKFKVSVGEQRSIFPIQVSPSVLDVTGRRVPLFYGEAVERLADLVLAHRPPFGRTFVYAAGDTDYFTHFALQEVGRLLGIRNLNGSSEFGLRPAVRAVEMLCGQEAPMLSLDAVLTNPNAFYLMNGWNGFITHLPLFDRLFHQATFDGYLVEVMVTETAKAVAAKLGPERVLLIKPGADKHLALAIAHEIFHNHAEAVDQAFIDKFADVATYEAFATLARSEIFQPDKVATSIAAEPAYEERLLKGIRDIAQKCVQKGTVPVHIPGAGLSQTGGVAAHALWNNLFALLGKWGLESEGQPLGGVLRLPYQENEQSQVQGLEPSRFFGNIELNETGCKEAALRMGLPENAYDALLKEHPRQVLDYAEPTQGGQKELIICVGTSFEGQMVDRQRWLKKLSDPNTTLVVIDPMPGPFFLKHAALCIAPPPQVASARLVQNGEWRLTLDPPRRAAPAETRSEATIFYDMMAEISRSLRERAEYREAYPDLAELVNQGYLQARFEPPEWGWGGELARIEGEVSRPELWERIQAYLTGTDATQGALYCRPENEAGEPLAWETLVEQRSLMYGGVGQTRYLLSQDAPFQTIYREPYRLKFFSPTEEDLMIPAGIVLNSGSSTLSDNKQQIRYAVASFLTGKVAQSMDMPETKNLFVSEFLAQKLNLEAGQQLKVTNRDTGRSLVLAVTPTSKLKGEMVYLDYHRSLAELTTQSYINVLSSHRGQCPYSGSPRLKSTLVDLEIVEETEDVS